MATELNKFMNIRQVQPLPVDSLLQPSQINTLGTITHIDPTKSAFFILSSTAGLNLFRGWDVSGIKLSAFAHSGNLLISEADIVARQPELDKFANLLAMHQADVKLSEIIFKFEKRINPTSNTEKMLASSVSNSKGSKTSDHGMRGESLQEFVARTKLIDNLIVFWDNLICRIVSKSNLDLVPSLAHAIRLSTVLYRASTNPIGWSHRSVGNTRYETVAVPASIFEKRILEPDNLCAPKELLNPCDGNIAIPWPDTKGDVQPLGWGDLKVIKSTLLRYAVGEIAHIENILAGEKHIRVFNDLRRTETTDQFEEETQTEVTGSLQTTDKFSFEKEVASASSGSTDFKTGLTTSAEYGQVKVDASLDYQNKSTKEESQKASTKYAKEVVSSATSKLTQRVRSMRSVSTTNQKKEKTSFEIDNTGKNNHSGIYRWVDKYYLAHVDNYGQRLMYEFVIPEPAAFFRFAKLKHEAGDLTEPISPQEYVTKTKQSSTGIGGRGAALYDLKDSSALTVDNYWFWVSKYGVTSVEPPPGTKYVSWDKAGGASHTLSTAFDTIEVPTGYLAREVSIKAEAMNAVPGDNGPTYVHVFVADNLSNPFPGISDSFTLMGNSTLDVNGKIPVSIMSGGVWVVNVNIRCIPSVETMNAWRISTYYAIMQAYNLQLNEYQDKLQQKASENTNAAFGMNPNINRQIEQIELKKSCIEIITGQRFETIDAMRDTNGGFGFPEFSFSEAKNEGDYIQFFEKAFEWTNITYTFTPYFWGRKDKWLDTLKISDVDPLFENFLRAGSARVVVPVRPGYENDIIAFFALGWYGMPRIPITIDDPRYVSIVEELKEQAGIFPGMRVEPERWVVKIPTTLVFLENSGSTLPDYTTKLWWQPKLRVIVNDSSANPITSALVTIRYLDSAGSQQQISLSNPNGTTAGSYDFMVDEGTYKIEAVDRVGSASLPSPGTTVIEVFQETEVVITLWRIRIPIAQINGSPIQNATVTLTSNDSNGVSQSIQQVGANGAMSGDYEFMVNPGTYRIDIGSIGTIIQVFQDVTLPTITI